MSRQNCPKGKICVNNWIDFPAASCIKIPPIAQLGLQFPFHPSHPIKCQQGNAVVNRSHSYDNILFAVDLHSLPNSGPGIIYAAGSGIAYIYDQCDFRYAGSDAKNDDPCGEGYGNHIRILHKGGYMTLYAHLSKILVSHQSQVERGNPIGVEGASGRAGVRHLHFSVHTPNPLQTVLNHPGWSGVSVPFQWKIRYSDRNHPETIRSTEIRWDTTFNEPYIYGVWDDL